MRSVAAPAALGALLVASPPARAQSVGSPSASAPAGGAAQRPAGPFVLDQATTWDLDVEGGVGRYFGSSDRWTGLVRGRAGILFVRDPRYDSVGVSFEYSSLAKATFGVEVEIARIDAGFWAQAGALLDVSARPGGLLSGGWSILGLEAQVRSFAGLGLGVTVFAKVSVPIGVVAHVLGARGSKSTP
ncbi:MAG TPA: hypothetical protein VEK07_10055 [Polyangiaceae bacterium]|nr:hypothetical protein [Polyangiaceae bacterium]